MPRLMKRTLYQAAVLGVIMAIALLTYSCADMKSSRPIVPMREYERVLVGSLFSDYVGNETCLKACHFHDQNQAFLSESVHGQQKVEGTDMPLVNCETCHGPGSEAINADYIAEHNECNHAEHIPLRELPAAAQSMLCLKCHSSYSMANMQHWPFSDHARAEVSCSDCHKLHKSSRQKLKGADISEQCMGCHEGVRAAFSNASRHPVPEGKMLCVDCHDAHGNQNPKGLKSMDQRGLCISCHGQLIGPFAWEHADVTDECTTCHSPHGSVFADMLKVQEPFLCLQCHAGHSDFASPSSPSVEIQAAYYTRCSNCHTQIHGSDTRGPHPGSGLTQ
jgi:DmsE family decaheme c-type cytochrome